MASLTAVAPLKFTVRRRPAVQVAPAAPTPRELKVLSDIDDQESVRVHVPGIFLYRRNESMAGRDPVAVIRDAVARALVHYYPLVGRLREVEGGKLAVDCTGEGADADIHLEQLGEPLLPPFPCLHELLFDVPGSSAIINAPLMLFQFGGALAELARGAPAPTVKPVWERELLMARDPPRPSFAHREYDEPEGTDDTVTSLDDLAHRCFFFTPRDVATLRDLLLEAPQLRATATTFDVLGSWRDVRKAPAGNLDFGWGRPVYGGPAEVGGDLDRGEELGIAVPVCLPRPAMERFAEEMGKLLQRPLVDVAVRQHPRSAL
nr:unnamed protein product [Digitaria exilis]